jgi:outer membrane protein
MSFSGISKKLVGTLLLTSSVAMGAEAPKYAVVNMQKVILSVGEGKSARAALEGEIKAKDAELQKKKQELDKMNDDWKSQSPLMSEDAKMAKQKEFQEKFVGLRDEEAK